MDPGIKNRVNSCSLTVAFVFVAFRKNVLLWRIFCIAFSSVIYFLKVYSIVGNQCISHVTEIQVSLFFFIMYWL